MASIVEIKQNYFKVSDTVSGKQLILHPHVDTKYRKDENDLFTFLNRFGAAGFDKLGETESIDVFNTEPTNAFIYPAAEIADSNGFLIGAVGAQWATIDEFENWLTENTAGSKTEVIINSSVFTDATLTGDGTIGDPLSVVGGGGGGSVNSVTGDGVDNADPANPVLTFPTPTEIGLGNVDNTSDINKPISTATQNALDDKLETVATDATISGDGTIGNPLSAVAFSGNYKNFSSTQWSTTASSVPLPDGTIANGMTFFTNLDKVNSGITTWDEWDLSFGIDLTISGTTGSITINFGPITGTEFSEVLTLSGTLDATVQQFVIDKKALALAQANTRLLYNGGSTMRFCSTEFICNSVATTLPTGDMGSTRINAFTGINAAAYDHILVPYAGEPYENKRLQHKFRVNFGIQTGSSQTAALSLRRFSDDSVVGSEMAVFRNQDVEGNQYTILTYTGSANDPFVLGGFYFALRNDSGVTLNINGAIGIYIETAYEEPLIF